MSKGSRAQKQQGGEDDRRQELMASCIKVMRLMGSADVSEGLAVLDWMRSIITSNNAIILPHDMPTYKFPRITI